MATINSFYDKIYNIEDFGARCECTLQTKAIQKALDTCFLNGGGRVIIPAGIYRTGGLRLRSNTILYLESGAILKGSLNPEDYNGYKDDEIEPIVESEDKDKIPSSVYPFSRWNNAVIRAIDAKNIAVIGEKGSYIDGGNCYDAKGEEGYRGPHGINIQRCENVYLDGYTITDCGNWAHAIFITKNIEARNLTVLGGHDGFDVRTCDNVLIEDCNFYSGDDCIAGFDNCDVVIRNCIMDCACSAMRFGGNNVLVENCKTYAPSRFGFRGSLSDEEKAQRADTHENSRHTMHTPFKYYCDFRAKIRKTPGDILIRNCEFNNPNAFFQLEFDGEHMWCCNRSLSSIKFENCTATGVSMPILIHGDEKEPLSFTLSDVSISPREGYEDINFMDAVNYSEIIFDNVEIKGFRNPVINVGSKGKIEFKNTVPLKINENK